MERYVIATIKSWNLKQARVFKHRKGFKVKVISRPQDLTEKRLRRIKPRYIFFPHWSWRIPPEIYEEWECVVFHMTDLPYGRGGSPLQNLIQRGIYRTKISALKVVSGLDAGPVYLKERLDLSVGSAEDIYKKASSIVFRKMIPVIIKSNPRPFPQRGHPVFFKRRTPEESNISCITGLKKVYDHIRMLDAEGYPCAYIDCGGLKFEFYNANLKGSRVTAQVRMMRKKNGKK